jgi:hypothetical protein
VRRRDIFEATAFPLFAGDNRLIILKVFDPFHCVENKIHFVEIASRAPDDLAR